MDVSVRRTTPASSSCDLRGAALSISLPCSLRCAVARQTRVGGRSNRQDPDPARRELRGENRPFLLQQAAPERQPAACAPARPHAGQRRLGHLRHQGAAALRCARHKFAWARCERARSQCAESTVWIVTHALPLSASLPRCSTSCPAASCWSTSRWCASSSRPRASPRCSRRSPRSHLSRACSTTISTNESSSCPVWVSAQCSGLMLLADRGWAGGGGSASASSCAL